MKNFISNFTIALVDIFLLVILFYIAQYVRINLETSFIPAFDILEIKDFFFVIITIFALMNNEKIYLYRYDFWQETQKVLKSFFLAFVIVLALLALLKTNLNYSRLFISIYFIIGALGIPFAKRFIKRLLFSISFFNKKVLLIGNEKQVEVLKEEFKENWYLGLKYSTVEYDKVIIASKDMSTKDINEKISTFLNEKCELYIVPYITNINFVNSTIMEYSNIRYNAIQVENRLLITKNLWLKLIFDKLFTLLLIPLFLLLHVVISIAIKLNSKGDSFFKQPRLGKDGQEFICYKYRTMYENSDEILEKYLKLNPEEIIYYDIFHKYKNDPRITKVGKFLRSTSLDELPQFINILKAEMSLVGPRPYMCSESEKLGCNQNIILKVKPGITGLWQVSGRNHLTFKERNELEIWYIKNWSLWTDFVILVKTIKVVLLKVGAH